MMNMACLWPASGLYMDCTWFVLDCMVSVRPVFGLCCIWCVFDLYLACICCVCGCIWIVYCLNLVCMECIWFVFGVYVV